MPKTSPCQKNKLSKVRDAILARSVNRLQKLTGVDKPEAGLKFPFPEGTVFISEGNPEFMRDLEELGSLAKRLVGPSPKRIRRLTPEELSDISAFKERAECFADRWDFHVFTENGSGVVNLFYRLPVSIELSRDLNKIKTTTHRLQYHPKNERDALEKAYFIKTRVSLPRRKTDLATDNLKVTAKRLKAQGYTVRQIAEKLDRREYRRLLEEGSGSESVRLKPLTNLVYYYLRS